MVDQTSRRTTDPSFLTESEAVLDLTATKGPLVTFRPPLGERADDSMWLDMSRIDWEDMGSPEQVTVTVRPGDRLNATDQPEGDGQ